MLSSLRGRVAVKRLRRCGSEESSGKQTEMKANSFLRFQVTMFNAKIDKQSANKARKTTIKLKAGGSRRQMKFSFGKSIWTSTSSDGVEWSDSHVVYLSCVWDEFVNYLFNLEDLMSLAVNTFTWFYIFKCWLGMPASSGAFISSRDP